MFLFCDALLEWQLNEHSKTQNHKQELEWFMFVLKHSYEGNINI